MVADGLDLGDHDATDYRGPGCTGATETKTETTLEAVVDLSPVAPDLRRVRVDFLRAGQELLGTLQLRSALPNLRRPNDGPGTCLDGLGLAPT